jgi:CRP-like cAMP-binding protein
MEDRIWYLKHINILEDLSKQQLMELGAHCSMTHYSRDEIVYLPGSNSQIYFLKAGSIKLISLSEAGKEIVKEVIRPGEIFGKIINSDPDIPEQAKTLEDSMVCYLPYERWQEFVANNLTLNIKIAKWMGLRIRRLERKMDTLYFKESNDRIVELLNDLASRMGNANDTGDIEIRLKLTHKELGQLSGTSRQSVTTFLSVLRDKGLIFYDRKRIILTRKWQEEYQEIH